MLHWKQPQGMELARLSHQKSLAWRLQSQAGVWKESGDLLAPCGKINLIPPPLPAAAWIP